MTAYPPGLDAHGRAAWDRRIANHRIHAWTYTWSRERQATVKRCDICRAEEVAPAVLACRVRVTATVADGAAASRPRVLPAHPLALPAAPSTPPWPVDVPRVAEGAA